MLRNHQAKQKIMLFMEQAGVDFDWCDVEMVLLAGGGSDRSFYRVRTPEKSYIVMTDPRSNHEIRAYADVGRFLFENGIGAPEIIACDGEKQLVLLEDLGDSSLYSLLKQAVNGEAVREYYKKVLIFLAEMQMKASPAIETCEYLKHRSFGYEAFRWETDYFRERFIKQFCGIRIEKEGALEDEFHGLAATLSEEPRYFMHRDFQSQNIYLTDGRVRVIDFQTATRGLLQYDLAALLKDAYFRLDRQERQGLLDFYMARLAEPWGLDVDQQRFLKTFHLTGLQRNMQALGAFAFLSLNKGKIEFMQHIPAALGSLKEALNMFPEYPMLRETVEKAEFSGKATTLRLFRQAQGKQAQGKKQKVR